MKYAEFIADSTPAFLELCREERLPFFRGQSQNWDLMPSLGRFFKEHRRDYNWVGNLEEKLIMEFKGKSLLHLEREPKSELEWLIQGQHYGLPTRLLDWTTSPLKALFFAVENQDDAHDGVVYFMEPHVGVWEDDMSKVDVKSDSLITFTPIHIHRRIAAQDACFTLFPLKHFSATDSEEWINLKAIDNRNDYYEEIHNLYKVTIPNDKKHEILSDLAQQGISYLTMYPDLEGVCKSIKSKMSLYGY